LQPATIKLFLTQGHPESLRTAEISNWTGKAISGPRTELKELLKRDELDRPGVYILTGTDPESNQPVIYIGEADSVATRIKGHSSKDYCDLPPIAVPLVRSMLRSLSPLVLEAGNRASYEVGCDYTPFSTVQSRPSPQLE